jgi:serine/threonine-protein kinase
VVGRYVLYDEIASGGMATVHFGRLVGAAGFSRTVAIKHLHPHFSRDAEFVSMFLDEARLATRIQHPNVTVPLDVVVLEESEEIFLIMEYVHGDNYALLLRGARMAKTPVLPAINASIMSGALQGLHAAHEAVNELGVPLNIVHRDVSPQNIMVGLDGVSRVLDFGIAKATSRLQSTRQGQTKGKFAYMAPEQMSSGIVDRRADIFAAGIVFWEALTMKPLFHADDPAGVVGKVMKAPIPRPSFVNSMVSAELDRVVMKALDRNANMRFQTARDFAMAIEEALTPSTARKVGEWVAQVGGKNLARRAERVAQIESSSFDPSVSSDPLQVLRSKRTSTLEVEVKPPENVGVGDSEAERAASLSKPGHISSTGRGELLPTPPVALSSYAPPPKRRTWPTIAVVSLLAFAVGVGIVGLSHWRGGNQVRVGNPGPAVQTAVGRATLPGSQPAPQTGAANPVVTAPTEPPERAPSAEPTAPLVPAPAGNQATPKTSAVAPNRHAKPKTTTAKLLKTVKGKRNCDPPYTIDPNGIRRVKPECL